MKIRDKYIRKTLLQFTFVVLVIWIGVYSFFNYLQEMGRIGEAGYTSVEALKYIVFQIPTVIYKHASPIILLGCILGMGHLATTSQLMVMQASGSSILKLTTVTVKTALFFIIIFIIIGESIAPIINIEAEKNRSQALGISYVSQDKKGFWIKDGDNFINVKKNFDGRIFNDITIIEVNSSNKIKTVVAAQNANFNEKVMMMEGTKIFSMDSLNAVDTINIKERNSYDKNVSFDQGLIDSLKKNPEELTTYTILQQIQFLSDNKLRSGIFQVELYYRLIKPFTLVAMILIAMLFIFGSARDTSLGRKIFFGVVISLSFEMISRVGGALSLSFNFNPIMSAILPTMIVMLIGIILIFKKSIN
jgi:lipopolysaccharide export system permease protein